MSALDCQLMNDDEPLRVSELLNRIRIEHARLVEMVEAGIASPVGASFEQWTFVRGDLKRIQIAHRLMADLDVNVAGAALILDLLDERNALLSRMREFNSIFESF